MTREEAARITDERLAVWRRVLERGWATPMLLIGVTHGEREGGIVVLAPLPGADGTPTDDEIAGLAAHAAIGLANEARKAAAAG